MRYGGTALLGMVAAFGAAFLIRRAEDAASVRHRSRTPRLASEFAPGVQRITRKRPKPKPRHTRHRTVSHSSGATTPTDVTNTPTYTTSTPTYTPTTTESAPTTGGSGTTHHSSGNGTGMTSIGGSGKVSGTTTIG